MAAESSTAGTAPIVQSATSAEAAAPLLPAADGRFWRVGAQATYIWQKHPGFAAAYDGPHSLMSTAESGYTLTATLSLGLRPWRGAELFATPEIIQSEELSELHGLGGFSNAENQKSGGPKARLYNARAFLRQTVNLGGEPVAVPDELIRFPATVTRRRVVISVGQMALIDVFDNNAYAHDGRTQFMNWSFLTHAASDYAADARGYTWGGAIELYLDAWGFRLGRFAQAKQSNGLALDFALWQHFGDNVEIEHAHALVGQPGRVRVLGVRNYARMGGFEEAVALAQQTGGTPDLAAVRRNRSKYAVGLALEQAISTDLGVFGRASWNDGRTETYAFTEVDRSLTLGGTLRGQWWRRPDDTFGLALAQNGISEAHRRYLASGGLGIFLGDGQLPNYAVERIVECYYSFPPTPGLRASAGYQLIDHPAYNADRGPVQIFSIRFHAEY